MRSQISIDTTTSTLRTTAETQSRMQARAVKIPQHEQDEDLFRYAVPGRDPVTQARGSGKYGY
jgi:hypothetical protein